MNVYFDEGYRARMNGVRYADNPHRGCDCGHKRRQWFAGWRAADAEHPDTSQFVSAINNPELEEKSHDGNGKKTPGAEV